MMRRTALPLPLLLLLAACAATGGGERLAPSAPARAEAGLDRVMGRDARMLATLFGAPALDIREGPARKLQYRGAACVLDAYLYPPPAGGEPRVTWIDTRTPQGTDFDRASCIAALVRQKPR